VVIGLEVGALDAAYAYCVENGCVITCEPLEEAWGERLFTCIDPFGYQWKFSIPIPGASPDTALDQGDRLVGSAAKVEAPADDLPGAAVDRGV
jgi:hypothetical protein